jgi:hypothetical protein
MQRRTFLRLGLVAGGALALAGAGLAIWRPGWRDGRLTVEGRELIRSVSLAVLDGLLPNDDDARNQALAAQVQRLEDTIGGFPRAVQDELAQLLALLNTSPGRLALTGLASPWAEAATADVQRALQAMRTSSLATRQQVYLAVRDLSYAAFFADPSAWRATGYPGPLALAGASAP